MRRILKIGMDVHRTNYTLCAMEARFGEENRMLALRQYEPSWKHVVRFVETAERMINRDGKDEVEVECGYEAGGLGFSLYEQLTKAGLKCTVMAPTTMMVQQGVRVKTDRRDAKWIAESLIAGQYKAVHIPDDEDYAVQEYIRMRDDAKNALKQIKQQILAFCHRHGKPYDGTYWTGKHLTFLRGLDFGGILQETLAEYLSSYEEQEAKVQRYDRRISELSQQERYREKVKKLCCFVGIKEHTALAFVAEIGDFSRFERAASFAAYLGLTPGEHSSAERKERTGITKAGNSHLRRLLIESSEGICRGQVGQKSKELRARQAGNSAEVIAYADRANVRLRSKYYRGIHAGKARNPMKTAIARELACFIWGMMTDHIHRDQTSRGQTA